jgi:hypothetical protein
VRATGCAPLPLLAAAVLAIGCKPAKAEMLMVAKVKARIVFFIILPLIKNYKWQHGTAIDIPVKKLNV